MTRPAESAGRWLERRGNAAPRGMTVILRKGRNRIPLTGLLHTFLFPAIFLLLAATAGPAALAQATPVEEVPFVTTPQDVAEAMLDLAAVTAGDHLIDLGSGDGRIVIAAARRGATALGVENDPWLVQESIRKARDAGVSARARFVEKDLFDADLSSASVVTLYLLPEVNLRLRPSLLALRPGTRVVSHDWDMGDWRPERSITLTVPEKSVGLTKTSRVHLWVVAARVDGLWCGEGARGRGSLRLRQSFQQLHGEAAIGDGTPVALSGQVDGERLALRPSSPATAGVWHLAVDGDGMRTRAADGAWRTAAGLVWRRAATHGGCPAS